jgi:PAS domain S-box-containing protein
MQQPSAHFAGRPAPASPQGTSLERLIAGQKSALELALKAAPLEAVLTVLACTAQEQAGRGARAAIFLVDSQRNHLTKGAAVGLPGSVIEAIEALPLEPWGALSARALMCGRAAVVEDLNTALDASAHDDERWRRYVTRLQKLRLRSLWSQTIQTVSGNALGVLAIYHPTVRRPLARDLDWLSMLGHCTALVVDCHAQSRERRRVEDALRRRTEQHEILLREAPLGVFLIDEDLRVLEVNPTARVAFGDFPDLIGCGLEEAMRRVWPPSFAAEVARLFRHTLMTGEPYTAPEATQQRIGREVPEYYEWQIHRIPLVDGRHGVVCYFRDISTRIQNRRQRQQQATELQTVLDLVPVGVAIAHDPQANHITANRRFTEEFGIVAGTNISLSGPERERLPYRCMRDGKEVPAEEQPMQRAARLGEEVRDEELEMHWPDGRVLHLMVSAAPLFDEQGRVRGAIAAHADITAFKNIQRELEAAGRQKDEFLAMLAHELRNPLAPIRNAVELLSREHLDPALTRQAVHIAQRQTAYLARLVDDLLDISRITRGRIVLQQQRVLLSDVIDHAVETVTPQLREKRHTVSITSHGVLRVQADPARLAQCLANLLTNSAKYTDPGGEIHIESLEEGREAVVRVSDNGAGISAELLPRIFDLFVQGNRTLDRAQGGLGIGLSVVKRLIEMHGGRVSARSAGLGQGSTFEIRLPLVDSVGTYRAPRIETPTSKLRILVVDDNADAALSLSLVLSLDGHEVHRVATGEETLEQLPTFRPDVVVLDIGLPGMDGYEVARRISANPQNSRCRLIALTGYGQPNDRQRALAAGFDEHLVKPVDFSHLRQILAPAPKQPVIQG